MHLLCSVGPHRPLSVLDRPEALVFEPIAKVWLTKETYYAVYHLKQSMQKEGLMVPSIVAGYRSYACQQALYNKYEAACHYKRYATSRYFVYQRRVAMPGCSPHQLGTTIDVVFTQQRQCEWFCHYACTFGFVRIWPKAEAQVRVGPNVHNEYRYIGTWHAINLQLTGLCLEEYSQTATVHHAPKYEEEKK